MDRRKLQLYGTHAQLYMKLAKNVARLETNTKSISHLSLTEAMKILGPLKQELSEGKSGSTQKKDPVTEAIARDALAILRRAWEVAGEPQRKIFIGRSTQRPLVEPPTSRSR